MKYLRTKAIVLILGLASCTNNEKPKQIKAVAPAIKIVAKPIDKPVIDRDLYFKNDSIFLKIGLKIFRIPNASAINYKNAFPGIHEIKGDSTEKHTCVLFDGLICFTTYDEVGMGYRGHLYAYDIDKKAFIYGRQIDNYLFSSGGIFILDRRTNKIFPVSKPDWYDEKGTAITAATMYSVKGQHFKLLKNIYEKGEKTYNDTSLVSFYKRSLANNAKHGITLPRDWWRAKKD